VEVLADNMQRDLEPFHHDLGIEETAVSLCIGLYQRAVKNHLGHMVFCEAFFDGMLHSMRAQGEVAISHLATQSIKRNFVDTFLVVHDWRLSPGHW
jgi:hypothetical protein